MKQFGIKIFFLFLRLHALLPLWYLLGYSRFIYFILYYLIGYRKKVVRANLSNSFPNKSKLELIKIERKFYQHLSDLLVENIWAMKASPEKLQKQCRIEDIHVFEELYQQKRDFICLLGHVGNWEWCSLSYNTYHLNPLFALYRPLKNKEFDQLFLKFRSRFGSHLLPMQQITRLIHQQHSEPMVLAFIADQSPVPEYAYWTNFLNQDTCFFNGYDKIARKKDYPVVLAYLIKVKRGKYVMKVELLSQDSAKMKENEITDLFAHRLEQIIAENPETWLWSHRRWKHKRPNN